MKLEYTLLHFVTFLSNLNKNDLDWSALSSSWWKKVLPSGNDLWREYRYLSLKLIMIILRCFVCHVVCNKNNFYALIPKWPFLSPKLDYSKVETQYNSTNNTLEPVSKSYWGQLCWHTWNKKLTNSWWGVFGIACLLLCLYLHYNVFANASRINILFLLFTK